MQENIYRSAVKTFSWRVLASLDTMIIAYFITGNFIMAISIGSIEVVTKIVLYFLHERVWNRISLGKEKKQE